MTDNQVNINVPMFPGDPPGYCSRRIDLNLSGQQAATLRRVREQASANHDQLQNGRHVETNNDIIKWLIEQIEVAAASPARPNKNGKGKR